MKNVCLFFLVLCSTTNIYSQDLQNANWVYGNNAGLSFLNPYNPIVFNGSQMISDETCASVSDQSGNLLFYTNGILVWNKNHQQMPNGMNLKSHMSITQGVIIVPRPSYSNRYYIVTIDGQTGDQKGLYYSEVDMSLSGGLGDIIQNNKNVILKDHNGIDIGYPNQSEKLTSAKHSNGVDYWIVCQIKDHVYSYLVSSVGISSIPTGNSIAPVDTNVPGTVYLPGAGDMKISPDHKKIAIVYTNSPGTTYWDGRIAIGDYNNTTGNVTFLSNTILPPNNPYSIEFSPQSQYIYFTSFVPNLSFPQNPSYSLSVMTNTGEQLTVVSTFKGGYSHLQRSINGKIYLSRPAKTYMSVINNPDNINNPDFILDSNIGQGDNTIALPQWVHWQVPPCPSDLLLTSPTNDVALNASDNRQASNSITASNIINDGATGQYHAGNVVYLKSGFNAKVGSNFRAYIEGCSGDFAARASTEENGMERMDVEDAEIKSFTMSPNPANEKVTIEYDGVISNLMVTSIEGVTMFNQAIGKNSYDLYVANYKRGIYVVTIQTQDGKILTEKLMKN